MKKFLVFGSSGFIGQNLIKKIKKWNINLYEANLNSNTKQKKYKCDLSSYQDVKKLIRKIKPNLIINLAGSFSNNLHVDLISNCLTSTNIIEALVDLKYRSTKLILIGSSSELTLINNKNLKQNMISNYSLSKFFQKMIFDKYKYDKKLSLIYCRIFNPYGTGVSDRLLVGNLNKQIKLLKKKRINKIQLGNLESARDYIHIDDLIDQICKVIDFGKNGNIYDLGTGKLTKTKFIVEKILMENNLNLKHIKLNKNLQFKDNGPIANLPKIFLK